MSEKVADECSMLTNVINVFSEIEFHILITLKLK